MNNRLRVIVGGIALGMLTRRAFLSQYEMIARMSLVDRGCDSGSTSTLLVPALCS
jgi:hypothetical protein